MVTILPPLAATPQNGQSSTRKQQQQQGVADFNKTTPLADGEGETSGYHSDGNENELQLRWPTTMGNQLQRNQLNVGVHPAVSRSRQISPAPTDNVRLTERKKWSQQQGASEANNGYYTNDHQHQEYLPQINQSRHTMAPPPPRWVERSASRSARQQQQHVQPAAHDIGNIIFKIY